MLKVCANCRREFSCFPQNCWCAELPHVMPMDPKSDCLCEECLRKTIAEKTPIPESTPWC